MSLNLITFQKSEHQSIKDARHSFSKPIIISSSSDTTEDMRKDALTAVSDAIRKYDNFKNIASFISGKFNKNYRKYWQIIVSTDSKQFNTELWHDSYLNLVCGNISIQMFRASTQTPSDSEVILEARKLLPSFEVIQTVMDERIQNEVLNVTKNAIEKYNNFIDLSSYLQDTFDKKHGKHWQCLVTLKQHKVGSKFQFHKKLFIQLAIGDLSLILYKNPTVTSNDVITSIRTSDPDSINLYENEMNKTMEEAFKKIALKGLNTHTEFKDIADYIKNVSEYRYGKHWNCIIGVRDKFSPNAVSRASNSYIEFGIGSGEDEIIVSLFKSKVKDVVEGVSDARNKNPIIIENTLNKMMEQDAITFTNQAITMYDNFAFIAKFVSQEFDEKYDGHWHCIIGFHLFFTLENIHKSLLNVQLITLRYGEIDIMLLKGT